MDGLLVVGIVVAFFAFAGALMYWSYVANKKRIEGFAQQAEAMGLNFTQHPSDSFMAHYLSLIHISEPTRPY